MPVHASLFLSSTAYLFTFLNTEAVWSDWTTKMGVYINKANCFNLDNFYGVHYDDLLAVKRNYNPKESLYVISGVGSGELKYYLDSKLD